LPLIEQEFLKRNAFNAVNVDVKGAISQKYSTVCLGAMVSEPDLEITFDGKT
jgi:hypothetical protein